MTLAQILETITSPDRNTNATKAAPDMLLDMNWVINNNYENHLSDLNDAITTTGSNLESMKKLLEVLNKAKMNIPADVEIPPSSWSKIPPDMRDELISKMRSLNKNIELDTNGNPNAGSWETIKNWISTAEKDGENGPNFFLELANKHFKKQLGYDLSSITDTTAKEVLVVRDKLIDQVEALKKISGYGVGDRSTNSTIESLSKVITSIDASFSRTDFPVKNWNTSSFKSGLAATAVKKYVEQGQAMSSNNNTDLVNQAISGNQNLSGIMTDQLKNVNKIFEMLMSCLIKVRDELAAAIKHPAQNISRA